MIAHLLMYHPVAGTLPTRCVNGEAAVNGNEVRRLIFPRTGGYETAAVDELLDRVATELDAGRAVANLIEDATFPRQPVQLWKGLRGGYDFAAVDGVLAQLRRQDDPAGRADPWRNLPAWRYSMASPDASAAELAGPARHRAAMPRAARVQAAKDYARECEEACRDFDAQPGIQLGLVKTGVASRELLTVEQHALVSARTVPATTFDRDGRTYRLSRVKAAQWPAVAAEIGDKQVGSPAHLPRTEPAPRTGAEAARRSNAIMTAVDQAGRQVARYMIAGSRAIDITVHPDQPLTDELILTLALTGPWVSSFFGSSGGGG